MNDCVVHIGTKVFEDVVVARFDLDANEWDVRILPVPINVTYVDWQRQAEIAHRAFDRAETEAIDTVKYSGAEDFNLLVAATLMDLLPIKDIIEGPNPDHMLILE